MINYKLAHAWEQMVHALVLVENGGHEPVAENIEGDGKQAIGILQQHPAWFVEQYDSDDFPASVTDTWSDAQIKAAATFLSQFVPLYGLDLAVQAYHKGKFAIFHDGERDPVYLAKFTAALNTLRGQHSSSATAPTRQHN